MSKLEATAVNTEDLARAVSSSDKDEEYWKLFLDEGRRTLDKQSQLLGDLRSGSFSLIKINLLLASLIFTAQRLVNGTGVSSVSTLELLIPYIPLAPSILLSWSAHQKTGKAKLGLSGENLTKSLQDGDDYEQALQLVCIAQYEITSRGGNVANKVVQRMFIAMALIFSSLGALLATITAV